MAKLTEDMVTARARGADITTLRKLNCWGSCLSDVSLLQRMKNLEVIAFSVNQISSLSDFTECVRLQELYLRGNHISDMNQLVYLQALPELRQLLLKENPIESAPFYRETVLRALPWLHKLDDVAVGEGEVENARRVGRELVHPLHATSSNNSSRTNSPLKEEECAEEYYNDDIPAAAVNSSANNQQCYADSEGDSLPPSPRHSVRRSPVTVAPPRDITPPSTRPEYYDRRSSAYEIEPESPRVVRNNYEDGDDHEQNSCDQTYRQVQDTGALLSRLSVGTPRLVRPTGIRSSNVLSSVLLLIKELDVVGLEVVQVAVESRIHELCNG